MDETIRTISNILNESAQLKQNLLTESDSIAKIVHVIINCLQNQGKILLCGNGGSAADAQHIACELVGRLTHRHRKALPAIAFTTNTSILTAVANDYNFDEIFVRQVEALANKGDVLIGISTSGNSPNVYKALRRAKELQVTTIGFLGAGGGKTVSECDYVIIVPSNEPPRIQEAHITIGHIICELVEKNFFF